MEDTNGVLCDLSGKHKYWYEGFMGLICSLNSLHSIRAQVFQMWTNEISMLHIEIRLILQSSERRVCLVFNMQNFINMHKNILPDMFKLIQQVVYAA